MTTLQKEAITTVLNLVHENKVDVDSALELITAITSNEKECTVYPYPYSPNTITYSNTIEK